MKRLLPLLLLVIGPAIGLAFEPKHQEDFGVFQTYQGKTTAVAGSSHTVTGALQSWAVRAAGGNCTFQIKHSTGSASSVGPNTSSYTTNVSSSIQVLSTFEEAERVYGIVLNPIVLIDSIDVAATCYVRLQYLGPRGANGYIP